MHITNEVTPADAGLEYADPDYCECEAPTETSTAPVMCLDCRRYVDPSRLERSADGSYRIVPAVTFSQGRTLVLDAKI